MARRHHKASARAKTQKLYRVALTSKGEWSIREKRTGETLGTFSKKHRAVTCARRLARKHSAKVAVHQHGKTRVEPHHSGSSHPQPEGGIEVKPGFGGAEGLIRIAPDFDEFLREFDDYT